MSWGAEWLQIALAKPPRAEHVPIISNTAANSNTIRFIIRELKIMLIEQWKACAFCFLATQSVFGLASTICSAISLKSIAA